MLGSLLMAGLAMLGMAWSGCSGAAATNPVRIDAGLVAGVSGRDPSVIVYKSIPYAAPPVGARRWRPPAPAAHWPGIRQADRFGAICPQANPPSGAPPMSEDCLTLNVWTGAASSTGRRPVLVWLHVFLTGHGSDPQFDGEALARKDIVVVTLNYRIGALGFLATPELSRESGHAASGNYGVLDQIAALRWVRRNIRAFGGDPHNVTIAGMSSQRGSSIGYLAVSPLAHGLYTRGISESQFPIPSVLDPPRRAPPSNLLSSAEADGLQFQQAHGVHTLAELRALPWEQLLQATESAGATRRVFQPIVDGWVIPHSYTEAAAGMAHNDAVYVVGNNLNEGGAPTAAAVPRLRRQSQDPRGRAEAKLTAASFVAWASEKFADRTDEFLGLYPVSTDDEAALQNNAVVGDYARIATHRWSSHWQQSASHPIYTYFWTHAPPARNGESGGAGHGSEISYVFNSLDAIDLPWTAGDRRIAELMSSYWANIATRGDPNGPGLPVWPAFDPASPTVMELGEHFAPMPLASPARLDFWRRFNQSEDAR